MSKDSVIYMVEAVEYWGDPGAGEDCYLLPDAFTVSSLAEQFQRWLEEQEAQDDVPAAQVSYRVVEVPLHRDYTAFLQRVDKC